MKPPLIPQRPLSLTPGLAEDVADEELAEVVEEELEDEEPGNKAELEDTELEDGRVDVDDETVATDDPLLDKTEDSALLMELAASETGTKVVEEALASVRVTAEETPAEDDELESVAVGNEE